MFRFLLGVLILAANFLGVSRAFAGMGAGCPGVMTMPIRGRARCATLILALALPAANAQNAYITNSGSNTVSVIDTATNIVTTTIPVGSSPVGVAVSPDGTKVYVANAGSNTVSVIDTATNIVTSTIPVGNNASGVAVTPDGAKVYVANGSSAGTVSVIDTATNKVVATIPVGTYPIGIAVTPNGAKVYVANEISGTVSVIDTATSKVVATILGRDPLGVAVTPDGTKAYVATLGNGTVSVIDTATNIVTTTIPVGQNPWGVAVTPNGAKVYVAHQGNPTVSVIDTATNKVVATIIVGADSFGVAVTPDGAKVYVANAGSNTVSVIDTASNKVTATIPVGDQPAAFGKFIGGKAFVLSSFPLKDTTGNFLTPYNAAIVTVFDHSMESSLLPGVVHLYGCDGKVVAFTGDAGLSSNGSFGKHPNDKKCADALGYENSSKTRFTLGRVVNYTGAAHFGGSFYLNYDGHPGYDYAAGNGTPVFAAVTGKISYPWNAVGMTTRNYDAYCYWHALALHPDNNANYIIYYLHLLTHPNNDLQRLIGLGCRASTQAARAVSFTPQLGCYKDSSGNPSMPTTLPLPEGTHVMSGCEIARSGQAGVPGSPHLHFEVQQIFETNQVSSAVRNHPQLLECLAGEKVSDSDRDAAHFCLPMDPYGWAPTPANCANPGQCPDPYQSLTGVPARKLWAQ